MAPPRVWQFKFLHSSRHYCMSLLFVVSNSIRCQIVVSFFQSTHFFQLTCTKEQLVWYFISAAVWVLRICLRCDRLAGPCIVTAWSFGRSLEPVCCSLPLLLFLFGGVTCFPGRSHNARPS